MRKPALRMGLAFALALAVTACTPSMMSSRTYDRTMTIRVLDAGSNNLIPNATVRFLVHDVGLDETVAEGSNTALNGIIALSGKTRAHAVNPYRYEARWKIDISASAPGYLPHELHWEFYAYNTQPFNRDSGGSRNINVSLIPRTPPRNVKPIRVVDVGEEPIVGAEVIAVCNGSGTDQTLLSDHDGAVSIPCPTIYTRDTKSETVTVRSDVSLTVKAAGFTTREIYYDLTSSKDNQPVVETLRSPFDKFSKATLESGDARTQALVQRLADTAVPLLSLASLLDDATASLQNRSIHIDRQAGLISMTYGSLTKFNTRAFTQYQIGAVFFEDLVLRSARLLHEELKSQLDIDTIQIVVAAKAEDFSSGLALPATLRIEYRINRNDLEELVRHEITSQALLDESVTLINGNRVEIDLQVR